MNAIQMLKRCTPVQATFLASLLLSLIALVSNPIINRDGILYVETARVFLQDGFLASFKSFNWPFLPILMAVVSKLTGIGIETTGHILNALFMAGACTLVVACTARRAPEAAWQVCLVVLALPGLNHYREELLREYGCWFFMMLTFWLALKWEDSPHWARALLLQTSLCIAALFRPEALALFPALIFWQVFTAPANERWKRLAMISSLPATGLAALLLIMSTGHVTPSRISGEMERINLARFDAKAQTLATALIYYARDQARTILFFGSLSIIPLKFIKQLGVFVVPLLFLFKIRSFLPAMTRIPLLSWAWAAHVLVLSAFVVDMQFLAGRYVAVLSLLASPLIGLGLWRLMQQYPRWGKAFATLALLIMISNVLSISPGQTQYGQAAKWLNGNMPENPRIFVESTRTAYYAGWRPATNFYPGEKRELLAKAIENGMYDFVILDVPRRETDIDSWLKANKLRVLQRFSSPRNDSVIITAYTR